MPAAMIAERLIPSCASAPPTSFQSPYAAATPTFAAAGAALDRGHHDPGERPELGADDHGADDQDLRVGQDPDRGYEGRNDHECKEAEGELRAHGRARLDLFPDDSVGG